jgi:hypothetical protein
LLMGDALQYPRVIIKCRYAGTYEGGAWAAFPCDAAEIPEDAHGGDVPCRQWWKNPTIAAGVGSTPGEALANLESKIEECAHPPSGLQVIPAHTIAGHSAPTLITCAYCTTWWHET